MHGARASLHLADRDGGGLDVELRIPWHEMTPVASNIVAQHA
jgi:hypothetical protein